MGIDIRPIERDEFEEFVRVDESAFGEHIRPEDVENHLKVFEFDRSLAAFETGAIVGTAGAFSLRLSVPGGSIGMPGVTFVAVRPTHRRRGILTSLMRRQLDEFREAGEAVAGLWASEGAIYQRFGYGLATLVGGFEIDRQRTAFARGLERPGGISMIGRDEAMKVFPPILDQVAERYPGMLRRTPEFWEHDFADLEHQRDGASPLFFAVHESPEGPDGYVAYRVKADWPHGLPSNLLRVRELIAATREAYTALWRFCFDMDLVATIEGWGRPADEPLLHLLAHPRALRFTLGDGLWLRIVDVPAALEGRRYSGEGRLTFQLRDSFCPWNEGRFELEGGPEGATCRRTDKPPQIVADAADLAAAYLGGTRLRTLHRAARVEEVEPGALARADAMFAWDPQPWCAQVF